MCIFFGYMIYLIEDCYSWKEFYMNFLGLLGFLMKNLLWLKVIRLLLIFICLLFFVLFVVFSRLLKFILSVLVDMVV